MNARDMIPVQHQMQKYYGEIKRNADAAWVMCRNEGAICNGKIEGCDFKSGDWCELVRVMEFMGMAKE